MYNFMVTILEAQVSFIFSLLCILKPYVLEKTAIEIALNANECV